MRGKKLTTEAGKMAVQSGALFGLCDVGGEGKGEGRGEGGKGEGWVTGRERKKEEKKEKKRKGEFKITGGKSRVRGR